MGLTRDIRLRIRVAEQRGQVREEVGAAREVTGQGGSCYSLRASDGFGILERTLLDPMRVVPLCDANHRRESTE